MTQNEKKDSIDIIVLTYQRKLFIKEFIEQLYLRTEYPFRLIVLDNGSTDGTIEWLKETKDKGLIWKLVFLNSIPMAMAFTKGMECVESEFFIVTQDDLIPPIVSPCWLTQMVDAIEGNTDYATVNMRFKNRSWEKWVRKKNNKI